MGLDLVQCLEDALVHREIVHQALAVFVHLGAEGAIPGLHRIGPPGHLDDGRAVEVPGEALQVDGGRGDDQLEIGATRQQGLEKAQQEVDVETALVGLVDDDGVVAFEKAVVLGLGQQDAVGHQLDQGGIGALILEPHLIADQFAQRRTQFLRHPGAHAARRQPARLGVADQPLHTPAQFQTDLGQLGGLAGTGLTGDHHHLVAGDGALDLLALGGDRQGVVVTDGRHAGTPRLDLGAGRLETLQPLGFAGRIRLFLQGLELAPQAMAIGVEGLIQVGGETGNGGGIGHETLSTAVAWTGKCKRVGGCGGALQERRAENRCAAGRRAAAERTQRLAWTLATFSLAGGVRRAMSSDCRAFQASCCRSAGSA